MDILSSKFSSIKNTDLLQQRETYAASQDLIN
jgi:hypothetical protein